MRSFFIQTFGCQMNEYDSERIAGRLEGLGFIAGTDIFSSDLVVLNTCSVRAKPEQKTASLLGKLRRNRDKTGLPQAVGVMGCMAQDKGAELIKRFKNVDFVLGTDRIERLNDLIKEIGGGKKFIDTAQGGEFFVEQFGRKKGVTAKITIMKGCNNFCSYCIVPYVRGRETCRNKADIISEAERLIESGVKDITLLGQNVNSYISEDGRSFPDLLAETAAISKGVRIRFVTSHPKDFNERLAEVIKEHKNICPLIHIPLQSGSDRILKVMNRGYTADSYLDKLRKAAEITPSLRFSTDIIVGFPGESEADFLKTAEVFREVEYETAYIFNYSPRSGTRAYKLPDEIPLKEKTRRLEYLLSIQEEITEKRYKAALGETVQVLAESVSKKDPFQLSGRTEYNRVVNFKAEKASPGDMVKVRITEVKKNTLSGRSDY
ncbi:MAG: tRNA (N6-isopentenyl adenosine(37)-C2)-methylthiotransferase MiaB [Deferribacteraceae bacterium]|jgi:tRNA-2-methylthio-N6-dimethylallyladenosine synthase|nr:tRNA (N6-isopentenyl adenosine(37)-C2)-methylthiotransferase MiaB [Deferribacteraceae bacterium]